MEKKEPGNDKASHKEHHFDEAFGGTLEDLNVAQKKGKEYDTNFFLELVDNSRLAFINAGADYRIIPPYFSKKIKQGKLYFIKTERYDVPSLPVLGTGKGENDEHINHSNDRDRFRNECCTTMTKKRIFKENKDFHKITERLDDLIDYSLVVDSTGQKRGPCELSTASQELTSMLGDDASFRMIEKIIYAFFRTRRLETVSRKELGQVLASHITEWLEINMIEDFVAMPLRNFVNGLLNGNRYPFDYLDIFHAIRETYEEDMVYDIFEKILEAKCYAQELLEKAFDEIEEKGEFLRTRSGLILAIESDNPMISKAARSMRIGNRLGHNAAVVWIVNTDGNQVVMGNKRFNLQETMDNIAAAIRAAEQRRRDIIKAYDYNVCRKAGDFAEWYYQREDGGGKLFNGAFSKSLNKEQRTMIPRPEIVHILTEVMNLGKFFKWPVWLLKEHKTRV